VNRFIGNPFATEVKRTTLILAMAQNPVKVRRLTVG
jgi:hypothetical protein